MDAIDFKGRTILITRPQPEASATARQVAAANGRPLLAPVLVIQPPRDSGPLQTALARLTGYDAVVITSANGARSLIKNIPRGGPVPPLFAVGGKTARVLSEHGWKPQVPAAAEGGVALARAILAGDHAGQRFLFLRAEKGRAELAAMLRDQGRQVDVVTAYRADAAPVLPGDVVQGLEAGTVDAVTFFSGRTVAVFLWLLGGDAARLLARPLTVAISPVTARALAKNGIFADVTAAIATSEGVLTALCDYWQGH